MNDRKVQILFSGIEGNLQVKVDSQDGEPSVYLDGDAKGLLSLAKLLSELANLNQRELPALPESGASEHVHLEPNIDLAASSCEFVIGRLDDKNGKFDETLVQCDRSNARQIIHYW